MVRNTKHMAWPRRHGGSRRACALAAVALAGLVIGGCGESEDPSAGLRELQEGPGVSAPSGAPVVVASLAWDVPGEWVYREPSSPVRRAEFVVAGAEGDAELVFFHFGPGQGGDVESNLARWARVVEDGAGEPVEPEIEVIESGEVRTVTALYRGTYLAGPPGGEKTPVENAILFGAVVEGGPEGSVFVRLVGPAPTVAAQADAFRAMLSSVRGAGV